jgi:hypothetical protein
MRRIIRATGDEFFSANSAAEFAEKVHSFKIELP